MITIFTKNNLLKMLKYNEKNLMNLWQLNMIFKIKLFFKKLINNIQVNKGYFKLAIIIVRMKKLYYKFLSDMILNI